MSGVVLIPARSGSKRAPRKNIRPIGGATLLQRAIAAGMTVSSQVFVSTECAEIASHAQQSGANVHWRPEEFSGDSSTAASVIRDFWATGQYDRGAAKWLLLLQPTSPFRRTVDLRAAVEKLQPGMVDLAISVSAATRHPDWTMTISGERDGFRLRRNPSGELVVPNGNFYAYGSSLLDSAAGDTHDALIWSEHVAGVMIDWPYDIDIDHEHDMVMADCAAHHLGL